MLKSVDGQKGYNFRSIQELRRYYVKGFIEHRDLEERKIRSHNEKFFYLLYRAFY
jgi:hypothetical protein